MRPGASRAGATRARPAPPPARHSVPLRRAGARPSLREGRALAAGLGGCLGPPAGRAAVPQGGAGSCPPRALGLVGPAQRFATGPLGPSTGWIRSCSYATLRVALLVVAPVGRGGRKECAFDAP
jgi:hypothetical protein